MAKYSYVATSGKNKTTKGEMEAADEAMVIAALTKQNLRPLSVGLAKKEGFSLQRLLGGNKVKSDDLVIFTRQLAAMVGAGVPLLRSLSSLESHTESQGLKNVLVTVIRDVEGGSTLGDALEKHPDVFNDVYVNMVRRS
jgi:type IV pilus assembly protein PilC